MIGVSLRAGVLSGAILLLGSSAMAEATSRIMPTRAAYAFAPSGVYGPSFNAGPAFPYSTGFESAEGFSPGALNGQAGWVSFSGTSSQPVVSTADPHAGTQHIRLTAAPAGPSSLLGGFSPLLTVPSATSSRTTVFFKANNVTPGPITGGAEYIIAAQEGQSPGDELSWQLNFAFDGRILVADNIDADPDLEVVDVGLAWVAGRYYRVDVDLDNDANQVRYFIDGTLRHTSIGGVFAGNVVRQVILLSDNFYVTGENGNYDSLTIGIIPEPAGLGLLAASMLGLRRRR